ncbi:MAG: hypothetical protein ACPMAQ_07635, partial [Phycisphaerae bacterium]
KVAEPFDDVAVAQQPVPGVPWYLTRMDVAGDEADHKRLARVSLTLRKEDGADLRGQDTTHVDLPVFSAGGHGIVRISIENRKLADGSAGAVTAGLVDVREGAVAPETRAKQCRQTWAGHLESWVKHGHYVGDEVARVEGLVKELRAAAGPVPPRILRAEMWKDEQHNLAIEFFDDSLSVAAFRIRESGGSEPPLVEDYEYPKGAWSPHGLRFSTFQPRTKGRCKDPVAWKRWADGECGPADADPVMWISLPTDSRRVEISLVDRSGMEGERLPLRLLTKDEWLALRAGGRRPAGAK